MSDHDKKGGIPMGALAVGALAGALAGILLAPKSGKQTRADIQDTVMKMKDDLVDKLAEMKDMTKEAYEKMTATVVDTYEKSKDITAEQAAEIKEDLLDGYEDLKKVASEAKEDIEKHL